MTLGACLVPNSTSNILRENLKKVAEDINRNALHATELNHHQKVYFSRTLSKERVLLFGLISLKQTLGQYRSEIGADSVLFYNKCVQYLLEKVGLFAKLNGIKPDQINIVFEERNHDYSMMIRFLQRCKETPISSEVALLNFIDPYRIQKKSKNDEALLQTADLVAHSLYCCVNKSRSNLHIPETRYLNELRTKFFHDENTGAIIGRGIKPVHNLNSLKLDSDVSRFLYHLNAKAT